MGTIRLTKENFEKQVVQYGFFAEQIPACFSSKQFADNLLFLMIDVSCEYNEAKKGKKNVTAPVTLSTYKNDISRRILSVPNPEAFLRVVKLCSRNWDRISELAVSDNSLSPITYLRSYEDNLLEEINCESIREANKAKSDFVAGIKKCISSSLGYQYRLKVDIANCYNSIYSHSIAWAICGKEDAKTFFRTKQPNSLKFDYELGDALDAFTRFQKNNETNGIVVGPFTSRIFSEIILAAIDKILRQEGFVFKRYVDDYKFYLRSEVEAQEKVKLIEKILNEYNFNLNLSKTEICRFPYENISSMHDTYAIELQKDGVFGVLNAAAKFHSAGEKGAYKYALKYIRNEELDLDEFEIVFPLLVNIMLLDPRYGKYVITFLKKNYSEINTQVLGKIINKELKYSLERDLQQESLLFLFMIHDLQLKLAGENVIRVLESDNDFSIIIALDIWRHHKDLVERTRSQAGQIGEKIKDLIKQLHKQNYQGPRWLLLHEVEMHNLLPKNLYTPVERTEFFKLLYKYKISFYEA